MEFFLSTANNHSKPPLPTTSIPSARQASTVLSGLVKQALSTVEGQIDRVLDIQPSASGSDLYLDDPSMAMWSDSRPNEAPLDANSDQNVTSSAQATENDVQTSQSDLQVPLNSPVAPFTAEDGPRLMSTIQERDKKIDALIGDGQRMALENGRLNQGLGNIKSKDIERESAFKTLETKHAEVQKKCSSLTQELETLKSVHRKTTEENDVIKKTEQKLMKQVAGLQAELQGLKSERAAQTRTLDDLTLELNEVKTKFASLSVQSQAEAMKLEMESHAEWKRRMDAMRQESEALELQLRQEMNELRGRLARAESDLGWRQDEHLREVTMYESKINGLQTQIETLMAAKHDVSLPFLRQIEQLQQQNVTLNQNWESIERQLSQQLQLAQQRADQAKEHVRQLEQRVRDLDTKAQSQSNLLEEERDKRSEMAEQFTAYKVRFGELQHDLDDARGKLAASEDHMRRAIEEAVAREKVKLEDCIAAKERELDERSEQLNERQRQLEKQLRDQATVHLTMQQSDPFSLTQSPVPVSPTVASQMQMSSKLTLLEHDVLELKEQLRNTTDARDGLADELVKTTLQVDQLKSKAQLAESLQSEVKDLREKHSVALVMLGEKTEQVQELMLDIGEMKQVYRQQIQELVDKLNTAPLLIM